MFNLKTDPSQLSSANGGVGDMRYVQYAPTRDVTGTSFPNGSQYIKFTTSGRKWWVPKRSYLRMRVEIKDGQGNVLELNDNIAPNMNLVANLFQSMELKINGTVVSRLSDYVPQIDTLHKRMTKSKSWLDSTGASTCLLEANFKDRQRKVSRAASTSANDRIFDIATSDPTTEYATLANIGSLPTFLDLATPNQVQVLANGQLRFTANGGTPIPDLSKYLKIGDYVSINDGSGAAVARSIKRIIGFATTVTTNDTLLMDISTRAYAARGAGTVADGRIKLFSSAGPGVPGADGLELIWQPCLSAFNLNHALPSGSYELVLVPQTSTSYRSFAVETILGDKVTGANAENFSINIVDMFLYVCEVEGPRVDNMSYYLDLDEINCQRRDLQTATGLLQEEFTVSPSSYALTLAFQDARAGSSQTSYSQSKFKIDPNSAAETESKLVRMFLKYAGMNKPQPDADPSYRVGGAQEYQMQRYSDSMLYSGTYFSQGGCETIEEWRERGPYYHFAWPKEQSDRSTRVNANYQFAEAVSNGTVLLFSHFKKAALIQIENGVVRDVKVEEM